MAWVKLPRPDDEAGAVERAAEVLLVQRLAKDRFHHLLQVEQREALGHQLEHDGAVFDLAAQAADGGGEDAAVVGDHRLAQR